MSALKAAVKAIPFATPAFRGASKLARATVRAAFRLCYWAPLRASSAFRAAIFDSSPKGKGQLLLSTIGEEIFVVAADDVSIGRGVFSKSPCDFEKLQRALSLLGSDFKPEVIIDVGANIGTICIPAVSRGFFRRAVAIEPEPRNFSLLGANIHVNRLTDRIISHNLALGANRGEKLLFELSETNFGDHRIRMSSTVGRYGELLRRTILVSSEPFDDVVGDVDPQATLVWMDVQGFEGYVLAGAKAALAKRPPLVIEFWPYGMERTGSYPLLCHALIGGGYTTFHDLGTKEGGRPVTQEALDHMVRQVGVGGAYTDLLVT